MSVTMIGDNVAIGANGVYLNGSKGKQAFANPLPGNDDISGKIAMWGSDNALPTSMSTEIERTGILHAGIEAKTRIALGKGPLPAKIVGINKDGYEQLEFVPDNKILDWLEMNNAFEFSYATLKDIFGMGNSFTQALLSKNRNSIDFIKRQDPAESRFEKVNEKSRQIENVFLSGDWATYNNADNIGSDPHMDVVPLLNRENPYLDLLGREKGHRFMVASQYNLTGRRYYSPAPWYSAIKWVKIAQGIPQMKEAMFKNQMSIKYTIEIHPKFWELNFPTYAGATAEDKKKIQQEWYNDMEQYLVGGENAFKSMAIPLTNDVATNTLVPSLKFIPIDDKIKDGKLLPDSAAANIEILIPLMINSALLGVDMPGGQAYGGGAGSGSNIREAYLVQVMVMELERNILSKIFNLVKRYNGWPSDIVFRYPNQILTTLNTGKNTQSTA